MEVIDLLRQQFKESNEWLAATMKGVTSELAHWKPPGTANPLGATYVHILLTQDIVANVAIKGGVPLSATTWANKVGISQLPPAEEVTRLGPMGSIGPGRFGCLRRIRPSGSNIRGPGPHLLDQRRIRPHRGNAFRQLDGRVPDQSRPYRPHS